MLFANGPAMPFVLMEKTLALPPASCTFVSRRRCALVLIILKDWVTDPTVVNTVSYRRVSDVILIPASALVMNDSFLHAVICNKTVVAKQSEIKRKFFSCPANLAESI